MDTRVPITPQAYHVALTIVTSAGRRSRCCGGRVHEEVVGRAGKARLGVGFGWPAGRCRRRRRGGEAEVREDGGDDGSVGEVGEDADGTGTALAVPNVELVNATEELGPGEASGARGGGRRRRGEGFEVDLGRAGGWRRGPRQRGEGVGEKRVMGKPWRGRARVRSGERGAAGRVGGEGAVLCGSSGRGAGAPAQPNGGGARGG